MARSQNQMNSYPKDDVQRMQAMTAKAARQMARKAALQVIEEAYNL